MGALIVPAVTPALAPCQQPHFPLSPCRSTTTTTNHHSSIILVRWKPPPPGCFKLNFNGSVLHDGSGRASIGGVLRDRTGRIVFAFAEHTSHEPIGMVEACALIRGLDLILEMGGFIASRPLLVEGDDLTLVRLLRGESRQTRIPLLMEDDILELLGRFRGGCEVRHIFREGNQVADKLTKEAYRCA
ncbi:hypothetical protein QOZ80_2BG0176140 [Eleusine coracana subsp. coracana]|nr:hypothetical protein QOZ80_2BG0176140 [Eleusine coracana subsp. coracana]